MPNVFNVGNVVKQLIWTRMHPMGSFHEQVVITYYKQAVPGEYQGLTINYSGSDEKLMMPRPRPNYSLTLSEVNPMLEERGYRE
jgi:hypothetical protein